MSFENHGEITLTFLEHPNFLHVISTGSGNTDAVLATGQVIVNRAKNLGVEYVIIEDQLDGPKMQPIDTFAWLAELSKSARNVFKAVAVVSEKQGADKQFMMSVAVNRGFNMALFDTALEAEQWLVEQISSN